MRRSISTCTAVLTEVVHGKAPAVEVVRHDDTTERLTPEAFAQGKALHFDGIDDQAIIGEFGKSCFEIINVVLRDGDRKKIGTREVPIIMSFLFRSHGPCLTGVRVKQARFLFDRAPVFQEIDLPL